MKLIARSLVTHPVGRVSGAALLLALSGCANSITPTSVSEVPSIAAADLPAGWTAPRVVKAVAPEFPGELKSVGIEGEVRLMCLIGQDGAVRHIATAPKSDAHFVEAARHAVQQWKFTPGSQNGQPVAMTVEIPLRFVYEDRAARPSSASVAAAHQP
jgi:protein TonB